VKKRRLCAIDAEIPPRGELLNSEIQDTIMFSISRLENVDAYSLITGDGFWGENNRVDITMDGDTSPACVASASKVPTSSSSGVEFISPERAAETRVLL